MRGIHLRSLALLAAAGLLALACGGSTSGGNNGGGSKGTIKIGVDLPESGAESSNGIPTLNGVKFAVSQVKTIDGYTIEVENLDDAVNGVHDPQKGAQNVQQLIADAQVIGMVGPFNSSVARAEIPITSAAHLVQVSPANTNQCLTKDLYLSTKLGVPADVSCTAAGLPAPADLRKGNPNNYFRVAATDDYQGPAGAEYATKVLHLTKIGVLSDNEVYGKGIADTFSLRFKSDGGTVVYRNDITNASKVNDFTTFLRAAKAAGAEAIYFGGTDSNNACVARNQMKNIFAADAPFLGGDGIVTDQCLKDAGAQSGGMHGTVAAEDVSKVPDAQSVISAFKAAYPNASDYGAYTIPAYDCAKLIIAAFDRAYKAAGNKKPTREQVRAAMANTKDFHGALGTYSLDSNGDITQKFITEYTAKQVSGKWEWDVDVQYDMGKILGF
jgi:branched-chain amino acid transport system substrate-binding protein